MPPKVLNMKARAGSAGNDNDDEEAPSQRKPANQRYLLQVDRQSKRSYDSHEEAEAKGREIKKKYPIVQVSIYDTHESQTTLVT